MADKEIVGRLSIAIAVTSLVVVAATAVVLVRPELRERFSLAPAAYAASQRIDVPKPVYDSSSYTLVLFARSTCPVCQQFSGFFRRLAAEAERQGLAVRLVSSSPLSESETEYAGLIGLRPNQVVPLDLKGLRLRRVPTFVIVDSQGEIHYAREGAIPATEQEYVLSRLTSFMR